MPSLCLVNNTYVSGIADIMFSCVMRKTASCALKRFSRTTSPKLTMMCANRAFLRTPEVELHGEHRFSPTPDLKATGDKVQYCITSI